MLRSVKELRGYKILAADGEIGKVHEFYFDDQTWKIRYLVVETGSWLFERRVLLSPIALGQPHWATQTFPVNLTMMQVKNSPLVDTDKPVSRQLEAELHQHYGWPYYWAGGGFASDIMPAVPPPAIAEQTNEEENKAGAALEIADPHLRSTREVIGYHIQASNGEIGHVENFVVDDEAWMIRYMVVDTTNWLPGKKLLVAPVWIESIHWAEAKVRVTLTRAKIKKSPEFDPAAPVNREYEEKLYDFYGRPKYWV
jgi:sporulation protein YlmC with PRC-barrel domain